MVCVCNDDDDGIKIRGRRGCNCNTVREGGRGGKGGNLFEMREKKKKKKTMSQWCTVCLCLCACFDSLSIHLPSSFLASSLTGGGAFSLSAAGQSRE